MSSAQSPAAAEKCFQIKGGRISVTTLELNHYDYRGFNEQLAQAVSAAPQFFEQMPMVIGLERLPADAFVDFIEICQLCQLHGLTPVAIRGGSEAQQTAATVAGLSRLPAQPRRGDPPPMLTDVVEATASPEPAPRSQAASEPPAAPAEERPLRASRLITAPVRSGQQVYAQGGDLIVMAAVSAGAEILADGHIHVYGPLRGRALAGIQGDSEARIFCQSLEAELISIAGHYRINEDLRGEFWRRPVKISLVAEQLQIEPL